MNFQKVATIYRYKERIKYMKTQNENEVMVNNSNQASKAIKNAIKLVKETEASWFKKNASYNQFGYYLNFSPDGNKMNFDYGYPAPFSVRLDYNNDMYKKTYILNRLKFELDNI